MSTNWGGIVAGAMEGGARAVGDVMKTGIEADNRMAILKATKEADLDKAAAVDELRQKFARQSRNEMATDINARTEGIIANQQADRLNNFYGKGTVGGSQLTPADISDEEKSMVQPSDSDRAAARQRAAAEGGWLSPQDEAAANGRIASQEGQNARLSERLASSEGVANARVESAKAIAEQRLEAALAKATAKGSQHDRLTTIVNSSNQTIKSLTESDRPKTPEGKANWQRQLDDATALRDQAMARLRRGMSDEPGPGYPDSSSSPKPSSGNSRADVIDALKAWNNGR